MEKHDPAAADCQCISCLIERTAPLTEAEAFKCAAAEFGGITPSDDDRAVQNAIKSN